MRFAGYPWNEEFYPEYSSLIQGRPCCANIAECFRERDGHTRSAAGQSIGRRSPASQCHSSRKKRRLARQRER